MIEAVSKMQSEKNKWFTLSESCAFDRNLRDSYKQSICSLIHKSNLLFLMYFKKKVNEMQECPLDVNVYLKNENNVQFYVECFPQIVKSQKKPK